MATDIRSLLRTELASRRINHPYAAYTSSGALTCSLCGQQIKSHSLWATHLRSASHLARVAVLNEGSSNRGSKGQPTGDDSKKRKVADDRAEGTDDGGRKRVRGEEPATAKKATVKVDGVPEGFFDEEPNEEAEVEDHQGHDEPEEDADDLRAQPSASLSKDSTQSAPAAPSTALPSNFFDNADPPPDPAPSSVPPPAPSKAEPQVDEDEWAQFEQEIAQTAAAEEDKPKVKASALTAPSTISAPALSAAELASKQSANKDDADQTKSRADLEREALEEEEEEAKRRLDEEFDAMEGFEQRLARLKMKREALRTRTSMARADGSKRAETTQREEKELVKRDPDDDSEEDSEEDSESGLDERWSRWE